MHNTTIADTMMHGNTGVEKLRWAEKQLKADENIFGAKKFDVGPEVYGRKLLSHNLQAERIR